MIYKLFNYCQWSWRKILKLSTTERAFVKCINGNGENTVLWLVVGFPKDLYMIYLALGLGVAHSSGILLTAKVSSMDSGLYPLPRFLLLRPLGKLLWFPKCIPRHQLHLLDVYYIRKKLRRRDRLRSLRGCCGFSDCLHCLQDKETLSHLFFYCPFSRTRWQQVW